jgi:asparagine synthetase B (glutamine-hydrolysing)
VTKSFFEFEHCPAQYYDGDMCGIYASISTNGPIYPTEGLKQLLDKRGPDHLGDLESTIKTANRSISVSFLSTVLALRGGHVTAQPLSDTLTESVLCWNGEAWKIGQAIVQGNDGEAILNLLVSGTLGRPKINSISCVLEVLQSISGPYAFVYLDKAHDLLYFGRDDLGRRSLLYNTDGGAIQLSSLADDTKGTWREIEADGIYVLALSGEVTHSSLTQFSYESSQELNLNMYHSLRASDGFKHPTVRTLSFSVPPVRGFEPEL